jgi:hypothetical protein
MPSTKELAMQSARAQALKAAEDHMRKAGHWWASFDRCVHRVRFWNVRCALRRCLYYRELGIADRGDSPRPRRLEVLKRAMDEAHDLKIDEERNMRTCAKSARGAETMARIFYEEAEEDLGQLIPHPQRWEHDG